MLSMCSRAQIRSPTPRTGCPRVYSSRSLACALSPFPAGAAVYRARDPRAARAGAPPCNPGNGSQHRAADRVRELASYVARSPVRITLLAGRTEHRAETRSFKLKRLAPRALAPARIFALARAHGSACIEKFVRQVRYVGTRAVYLWLPGVTETQGCSGILFRILTIGMYVFFF